MKTYNLKIMCFSVRIFIAAYNLVLGIKQMSIKVTCNSNNLVSIDTSLLSIIIFLSLIKYGLFIGQISVTIHFSNMNYYSLNKYLFIGEI